MSLIRNRSRSNRQGGHYKNVTAFKGKGAVPSEHCLSTDLGSVRQLTHNNGEPGKGAVARARKRNDQIRVVVVVDMIDHTATK